MSFEVLFFFIYFSSHLHAHTQPMVCVLDNRLSAFSASHQWGGIR